MRVDVELNGLAPLGKRGERGNRNGDFVADTMHVQDNQVRMFFENRAAQMSNHGRRESRNQNTGVGTRRPGVSMRRSFFVEQVRNGQAEISGDDARHLTRVLRVEPGERYEISDNRNVYLAEIETARKEHVVFRTMEKLPAPAPSPSLVLCAALIKFDRFEWMLEKATELGVSEIVPVETIRSERGLERAARKRVER